MSVKLMGEVWGLELDHNKQVVLLALADHADDDGRNAYPGVDRLAWKTGYHERTVRRVLTSLEKEGLLEVEGDKRGGRGRTTMYRLRLEKGVKKPPFEARKGDKSPGKRSRKGGRSPGNGPGKGDNTPGYSAERVASDAEKGDTAVSAQPSVNRQENPSQQTSSDGEPSGTGPPPADDEAEAEQEVDADEAEARREMEHLIAKAKPKAKKPRRFEAEALNLLDSYTAWRDAEGNLVPWSKRPRYLRMAIRAHLGDPQYRLHSCLRDIIPREENPYPIGDRSGSAAAEAEHYERHRQDAARRGSRDPTRAGDRTNPAGGDEDDDLDERIEAWQEANPSEADRLLQLAQQDVDERFPEEFRTPSLVRSKYRLLVRDALEKGSGADADVA
ncbi:MAG: helix-turn-helix domain-containing protein [Acidobacteriota bacterium]